MARPHWILRGEDVASAVVSDDGTTLTVTLSADGKSAVHALSGFGGTGSNADSIDVSAGLLRDGAGNLSSAASTATSAVELLDDTAPVLGSIDVFLVNLRRRKSLAGGRRRVYRWRHADLRRR